jgi:hypothetical protein
VIPPAPALGRRFEHTHVLPSGKRVTLTVETVPGTIPWEQGWPIVENLLFWAMVKKLPELRAKVDAERYEAMGLPEYIEGGI